MSRASELKAVSGWTCKERDRTACRNPDGCHCREITALRNTVDYLRGELGLPQHPSSSRSDRVTSEGE